MFSTSSSPARHISLILLISFTQAAQVLLKSDALLVNRAAGTQEQGLPGDICPITVCCSGTEVETGRDSLSPVSHSQKATPG